MRRFPIANVAGKVQRRGAILVGQIDSGSRVHEELHAQRIAVDARVEQRGGAIRVVEDEDELADRVASVWTELADGDDEQVPRRFIETRRGATRRQL